MPGGPARPALEARCRVRIPPVSRGGSGGGAGVPRCERAGSAAWSERRILGVKPEGTREMQQGLERGRRKEFEVQKRECLAQETSV